MNRILLRIYFFIAFAIASSMAMAQDPQYSQYYNSPLYLNPAFAGTGDNTRGIVNFRSQWPGISSNVPYSTYSVSLDHNIEPYNSGVGLLITRDRQGGNMTTTDIGLMYAYQADISPKWSFRPALQASIVSRNIDYSQLVFGDQLSANGITGNPSTDQLLYNNPGTKLYPDFAAGGLLFSDLFWFGISGHHLSKPNIGNDPNTKFALPIKYSAQAGMRIPLGDRKVKQGYRTVNRERSFLPSINFKKQGPFDQLDLGAYMILEPVMFGLTYRGIPIQSYQGFASNESIIFMAGIHFQGFSFAYSYDIVISQLTLANSAGAHEVSLIYEWDIPYPKSKKQRPLPCPRFYKSGNNAKR